MGGLSKKGIAMKRRENATGITRRKWECSSVLNELFHVHSSMRLESLMAHAGSQATDLARGLCRRLR